MQELPRSVRRRSRTAIVPHGGRPSVVRSVESLVATSLIDRIVVITIDRPPHLDELRRYPSVSIVQSKAVPFCKAALLNEGLSLVASGFALVSDADIVWTVDGLSETIAAVEQDRFDFAWVNTIFESEPLPTESTYAAHARLGFRVVHSAPKAARVELFYDDQSTHARPGYGLLYGARSAFECVGGYKTGWGGGWGWEDVDIILRAKLLGLDLAARGTAIHLTHDDTLRALRGVTKTESRDHNIALSRSDICAGRLLGALANPAAISDIVIQWADCRHPDTFVS